MSEDSKIESDRLRDLFMHSRFPVRPAPYSGDVGEMDENGHRFWVARNGLFVQVKLPWLDALLPITEVPKMAVPFGLLQPSVKMAHGKIPKELARDFLDFCRIKYPHECCAYITCDEAVRGFNYYELESKEASGSSVTYLAPELGEQESIIIDMHSHGEHEAFFSNQDDIDDGGAFKIAMVFGKIDEETPEVSARLCIGGMFIKMKIEDIFEVENGHEL